MKKIKTYYITNPNMGDHLNVLIFKKVFGYTPIRRTPISCTISGIGSGLGKFCYSDKLWLRIAEYVTGVILPHAYVWGTGFMEYRDVDRPLFRHKLEFCAVRGELSKKRIEKLVGYKLDIPTCDGGVLASKLFDEPIEKKYKVGIIPHIKEQKEADFQDLHERFENSIIIDLLADPMEVVRQIASCGYVISSSLHGLIVADSFHIPNVHVKVTNNMMGDGFKFDDYYSGYGIQHKQYKAEEITDLDFIISHYEIEGSVVEEKKKQMEHAFPL